MTVETFFKKFELLADMPNAVEKMRDLVLSLATQGKLVAQRTSDEPADVLLGRIEKKLVAEVGKRHSPVADIDGDSIPEIPANWVYAPLGNVAEYGSPIKAESNEIDSKAWLLDLEHIEKDTSRLLQRRTFAESPSKSTKTAFRTGDVLYGKLRPYLNKVIVADSPGYATTEIVPIRAFGLIEPAYLCYALRRPEFVAYATRKSYGMNLPRLSTEDARRAPFPLPPLAEQKRIVAKVDELMELCDRLEAEQAEREAKHAHLARAALVRFADAPTPANLTLVFHDSYTIDPADLRESIITMAMRGKLVPQEPSDRTADESLARIRVQHGRVSEPAPAHKPIDENEAPFALPPSWAWVRLGELADVKHGYAFSSEKFTAEATPFVLTTPGNFYEKGGFRDRGTKTKYYRGEVDPSFVLKPGDLIIPMTEQAAGLLGSPAFIPDDGKTYLHNQRLGKLSVHSAVAPGFLFWFCNWSFFRGELASTCTGMKVRHTSPKKILRVPFPLCSLPEQRRIVAKVDQLMALVDRLEAQLAESRAAGERLMEAVVAEITNPPGAIPANDSEERCELLR